MSRTEPAAEGDAPAPERMERRLSGIAVSAGVAIGPLHGTTEPSVAIERRKIAAADTAAETARLEEAIGRARRQLGKLRARLTLLPEQGAVELAPLLDAYEHMLGPSRLIRGTRRRVAETLISAESAVAEEVEAITAAILVVADEDEAARQRRAEEVREIGRRLIRNLTRQPFRSFRDLPQGAILCAEGLRPAEAALIEPGRIAGVITEEGGADGHAAIMLRALGVPAVLGVTGLMELAAGVRLAVADGSTGTVILDPLPATLADARRKQQSEARERQKLARLRRLQAETEDGVAVELQANLDLPAELGLIVQAGAMGIGLLRSEFLFMNREQLPDEDAQAETYRAIVEAMAGDPVIIRVLDWGGEKEIEALSIAGVVGEPNANPALGLRGIRLLLRHPALFETQLAAIMRAAAAGPVGVLLPMITTLGEVRATRHTYERVFRRLRRRGERMAEKPPPLGVMIETPGAALAADALALESDFFAIGTNDLSMYTLAVDRAQAEVAGLYDPLHPAVLRLVQFATEAALRLRKPVSICGEMAGNPRYTALLLGLGIRRFSMNAGALPRVKQAVRGLRLESAVRLARRVMEESDPERIRALVDGFANHSSGR